MKPSHTRPLHGNRETALFVDSQADLERLVSLLEAQNFIAVDTEFVRERTYYPELCLIQVANESVIACVDALSFDDLSPLWKVLLDPGKVKVLHAARQDLELFYHACGDVPAPVFDTQIGAGFLGHGGQTGYAALVYAMLGIEVDKSQSRTDWTRRPLAREQLEYAAADVEHLVTLYAKLQRDLGVRGRLDWAEREASELTRRRLYQPDPDSAWQRVKGSGQFSGLPLESLKLLAAWRERRAMNRDRPRQWILRDAALLDIARQGPESAEELARVEGVPPAVRRRDAKHIVELIDRARESQTTDAAHPAKPLTAEEKSRLTALMKTVKEKSAELDISPELLATRKELEKILRGDREQPVLQDWRREVLGADLLEQLADPG